MNKTGFLIKIGMVIILLQGLSYCPGFEKEIDQKIEQYLNAVLQAIFNQDIFYNHTEILGKGDACPFFEEYIGSFMHPRLPNLRNQTFFQDIVEGEITWEKNRPIFLAHIATLAQDSPKCWNAQIKKIENIIKSTKPGKWTRFEGMFAKQKPHIPTMKIQNLLKDAKFLYEVFLDSAARSYVFMEKEYLKNRAWEKWYHIPARLLKTPPDFYILAVLHSIKIHMPEEFENIKNDFLKNFRSYLQKSNMSDSDINNVMKQIEKKSTPSYISRYWKWVLAGVITTVGVSYWIYKNQASYQKGGVSGLFEEAGRQISEKYQKTKEKLFGNNIITKEFINPKTGEKMIFKEITDPKTHIKTYTHETVDSETGNVKFRVVEGATSLQSKGWQITNETIDPVSKVTREKTTETTHPEKNEIWLKKEIMNRDSKEEYRNIKIFNEDRKTMKDEITETINSATGEWQKVYETKDPESQITVFKQTVKFDPETGIQKNKTERFDSKTGAREYDNISEFQKEPSRKK